MTFTELNTVISDVHVTNSSYTDQIIAKSGDPVTVFANNTFFYSVYNPVKDAEKFSSTCNINDAGFVIIGGMGNAYHITALYAKHPSAFFLIVEDSYGSYKTLFQQNDFSRFNKNDSFQFCTITDLEKHIIDNYKPAIHGTLYFNSIRSWSSFHQTISSKINGIIQRSLDKVSSDYSVQTHFGKVWMRNIFRNIQFLEQDCSSFTAADKLSLPVYKTAAIIAAGPSLDDSINIIKKNPEEFYIIATDTALEILHKYNITCDAFVTIDGQNISSRLFTNIRSSSALPNLAVIDCSAHPNAVTFSAEKNIPVLLCSTGHPLSNWFQKKLPFILPLYSGSGTVTITAADFAVKAGFSSIVFFGADFSCPKGKPYAKGSYLDTAFMSVSKRYNTIESQFNTLLFRGSVIKSNSVKYDDQNEPEISKNAVSYFTPLLTSYKESLLAYINTLHRTVNFYSAVPDNLSFPLYSNHFTFDEKKDNTTIKRLETIEKQIQKFLNLFDQDSKDLDVILLPYFAWYLKSKNLKPSKSDFFLFKTLVKKQIANYTDIYHES